MKLGLCLSGGGAKGAAHIGVLKAFEEENIEIEYLSGCSSGSIVATLYAIGYSTDEILDIFCEYCKNIMDYNIDGVIKSFFTMKLAFTGFIKGNNLQRLIGKCCKQKGVVDISQIRIPIAIPTVDLVTGEIIYFTNTKINDFKLNSYYTDFDTGFDDNPTYIYKGNIAEIVRASCSFPGVFEPKVIGNKMLVDGGVRENMPSRILKQMGADKVVAVAFDSNKKNLQCKNNIINVSLQAFDILSHQATFTSYKFVNVLLKPKLPKINLIECNKEKYIARQGYLVAKQKMKEIKRIF